MGVPEGHHHGALAPLDEVVDAPVEGYALNLVVEGVVEGVVALSPHEHAAALKEIQEGQARAHVGLPGPAPADEGGLPGFALDELPLVREQRGEVYLELHGLEPLDLDFELAGGLDVGLGVGLEGHALFAAFLALVPL